MTSKLEKTDRIDLDLLYDDTGSVAIDFEGDLELRLNQSVGYIRNSGIIGLVDALDKIGVLKLAGYEKPKPPLPTGLGAVVRDKVTGDQYVLAEEKSAFVAAAGYLRWQRGGHGGTWWSDRDVASFDYEILSEGVAA